MKSRLSALRAARTMQHVVPSTEHSQIIVKLAATFARNFWHEMKLGNLRRCMLNCVGISNVQLSKEIAIDDILHIAEIPYESGVLRFRYSRELSEDGTHWIRHGLFTAYHETGHRASEGLYEHGLETGTWRDYQDNGQLAAEGEYVDGKEHGVWRHWDRDGREEQPTRYEHGEEVAS